jgi:hypothetical protein
MIVDRDDMMSLTPAPTRTHWSELWHLWTVILPRRAINGQIVIGKVWRRHDGQHWIYKKITEYGSDL